MLFQRYSDPMILLNQMIRTRRLYEFIIEVVQTRNEELNEKASWEYWLFRDSLHYNRSFAEFREALKSASNDEEVTDDDLVDIVRQSADIASMSVMPQTDEGEAD